MFKLMLFFKEKAFAVIGATPKQNYSICFNHVSKNAFH